MPLWKNLFAEKEQASKQPKIRNSKMKRRIVVALAVLGVCMVTTASASAHLFHATKLGTLLGQQTGSQVFTTKTGGLPVACTSAVTTGSVTALLGLHQLVTVTYTGCTVLSIVKADISPAVYLLSADGLAAIEKTIEIKILGSGTSNCSIKVLPQDLGTVKYKTDPSNSAALIEESEVEGITSDGSGGECGTANTGGTYTGNNLIRLDGGSLGWS
jgi:hypothetical protein